MDCRVVDWCSLCTLHIMGIIGIYVSILSDPDTLLVLCQILCMYYVSQIQIPCLYYVSMLSDPDILLVRSSSSSSSSTDVVEEPLWCRLWQWR